MFSKIKNTAFPPLEKPILIWDGQCGFCKFWVLRLKKYTRNTIDYAPYQEVADRFQDIPLIEFKRASRLIEKDGRVYSGPDSLYRGLTHSDSSHWPWHRWYRELPLFQKASDHGYHFIAKNRPAMFKVTKVFFGDRPERFKPFWVLYLVVIALIVFLS